MNRRRPLLVAALMLSLLTAGCGDGAEDKTNDQPDSPASVGPPSVSAPEASSGGTSSGTSPSAGDGSGPAAAAASWPMPDLTGQTLQAAQDEIQSLTDNTVFFTSSHDATGAGRAQLVDSNWTVCTQSVAAGDPITVDTTIDFGAVKLDETCP